MSYRDLREFLTALDGRGLLKRVAATVDPEREITSFCHRACTHKGLALLFEQVKGSQFPFIGNLFGTENAMNWHWAAARARH